MLTQNELSDFWPNKLTTSACAQQSARKSCFNWLSCLLEYKMINKNKHGLIKIDLYRISASGCSRIWWGWCHGWNWMVEGYITFLDTSENKYFFFLAMFCLLSCTLLDLFYSLGGSGWRFWVLSWNPGWRPGNRVPARNSCRLRWGRGHDWIRMVGGTLWIIFWWFSYWNIWFDFMHDKWCLPEFRSNLSLCQKVLVLKYPVAEMSVCPKFLMQTSSCAV